MARGSRSGAERGGGARTDPAALGNAVQRLREGLVRHQRDSADEQVRDGLIQRFEFTYELSNRILRRYLMETAASPDEIERMPFADLIRTGNAQGLLHGEWPAWRRFREMRTRTSHTYDAKAASEVVAAIPQFLEEAEHFLAELKRRLR
jgi:nucleotidyltransferase substrate binding protein (TIGR01987 family)